MGFNASRYTGGDKNEQDNIRNGMRIYTNDRQHNITQVFHFSDYLMIAIYFIMFAILVFLCKEKGMVLRRSHVTY